MKPEDNFTPSRQNGVNPTTPGGVSSGNYAAANIIRSQIDDIFEHDGKATTPTPEPKTTELTPQPATQNTSFSSVNDNFSAANPYERNIDDTREQVTARDWNEYHSAWQNYYQQFYERYYLGQIHETKKNLETAAAHNKPVEDDSLTKEEAVYDLKNRLLGKVRGHAQKVRNSRHFVPIMAGVGVMLVFLFLQYNRVIFSNVEAYISPGYIDPANIIVDPNSVSNVGPETKLIIPKIVVDVPIILDAVASNTSSLNDAMNKGVAWFNIVGANALPSQKGNFVVSGHSSNDIFDQSEYKFIFARLEQLKKGDNIYVNYGGKRYTYTIYDTKIVSPTDVSALTSPVDKPIITLITCTPLGTDLNRLLVFGEQTSPDPASATEATKESSTSSSADMPGNTPSVFERMFGR